MTIIWRIALVVSLAFLGLVTGAWIGGRFLVGDGAGLAGAGIALGYGMVGGLAAAIVGLVIGFQLTDRHLRNVALAITAPSVVLFMSGVMLLFIGERGNRDPAEAYAPAGDFTVTMVRLDQSDPYLFSRMEVDAGRRTWIMTGPAPGRQICTGTVRAKYLVAMREALDRLAEMNHEEFRACESASGPTIKRVIWALLDSNEQRAAGKLVSGDLDVPSACAKHNLIVARALATVEAASRAPTSKVKCR